MFNFIAMKKIIFSTLLFFITLVAKTQDSPAFWNDILAFKKQDQQNIPALNSTLFIGSSSFTLWKDPDKDFPGANIINRGFGGSTLVDVIRYFYEVVYPYRPKKIFIYCGENDIASSDTITAEDVYMRFQTLYSMIHTNFPSSKVYYISMKPSPSRENMQNRFKKANMHIRKFLSTKKNAGYIDIYNSMLTPGGKMREDIYIEDRLHMNSKGYDIWIKKMRPYIDN